MEVLLLQDIPGVGKQNDLLIVGDGYALNHLLPHRKALVATPTVRKRYAELIRKRAEEKMREREMQAGAANALAGKKVVFRRKVTKTGKLYAAITEKHIAEAANEQLKITINPDTVEIAEPIKAVGTYTVNVKLGTQAAALDIAVEAE